MSLLVTVVTSHLVAEQTGHEFRHADTQTGRLGPRPASGLAIQWDGYITHGAACIAPYSPTPAAARRRT